jgi:tetratricopeptide (TPR) repeat protein
MRKSGINLPYGIVIAVVSFCMTAGQFVRAANGNAAAVSDEVESQLPIPAADQIIFRAATPQRGRSASGIIQQLSGQTVVLRREADKVEVYSLRDVEEIRFRKSAEYEGGLKRLSERDWSGAITKLQAALQTEPREWARREIRASLAFALRCDGQFSQCLAEIEKILEEDPETRHVVELPLIWDERLPAEHRIELSLEDLRSKSVARQLTAASLFLQQPQHETVAIAVLSSLRKSSRGSMQTLVAMQLWRVNLLRAESLDRYRVDELRRDLKWMDRRLRSGPEFLLGRALLLMHDYDNAATSLLWMPLLEPLDPWTTAASLNDAVSALQLAGRTIEAESLRQESLEKSKLPN